MALEIELVLEERREDRVRVTLVVSPAGEAVEVDGASLQLVRESGDPVCPRLLVPIRGELHSAMATTLELRASGVIAPGCRVLASAWCAEGSVQVSVPADPFVTPAEHVLGRRLAEVDVEDVLIERLGEAERAALARRFPWIETPTRSHEPAGVIEADEGPSVEELQEGLGLDEEDAAWLRELLDEP